MLSAIKAMKNSKKTAVFDKNKLQKLQGNLKQRCATPQVKQVLLENSIGLFFAGTSDSIGFQIDEKWPELVNYCEQ